MRSDRMKTFVDALMNKMTLDEKIGQLNLPGAGDITTGGRQVILTLEKDQRRESGRLI